MKKTFKENLKQAISAYYHYRLTDFVFRSKEECLDDIEKEVKRRHNGLRGFQASAGTFWFFWVDGDTTIHNEQNWLEMQIDHKGCNSNFYFDKKSQKRRYDSRRARGASY